MPDAVDISVVIPTFRRPKELVEAIRSALAQDGGLSIEVHVFDDSPEGSGRDAVASVGDARVTYLHRAQPTGGNPARVRNEGWRDTKGRFIHFLDDDDRAAPGAYQAMVGALERHPDRGVAFGRVQVFGNDPKVLAEQQAYFEDAARRARLAALTRSRRWMVANMLFKPSVLVNSACMLRRGWFEQVGGYDEGLSVFEDVDFYLRTIRVAGCVFVDQPVLEYRTGAPSIMHNLEDNGGSPRSQGAYRRMQEQYRAKHGALEFMVMKLFSRTVLRVL
jgi:glycosyltransferase involved in cell wall biosynthesis